MNLSNLSDHLIDISRLAGDEILDVYNGTIDVTLKEDLSPLTDADRRSNTVITNKLVELYPDIPILSEEGKEITFDERKKWDLFWLIDPLDGTKEFIKRNGEFTVNIALIENNTPIFGVIHIPVTNETYWGSNNNESFYSNENDDVKQIHVSENNQNPEWEIVILLGVFHGS